MNNTVEILLATYRPNLNFLYQQLESINNQDYPHLFLQVRDDGEDDSFYSAIETALAQKITVMPYELKRNEKNIGSNSTFERLTEEARGDWLAYCDQDDIWLPTKISTLVSKGIQDDAVLVYSDLAIIDAKNKKLYSSFRDMNPRLRHVQGNNLFDFFLRRNSVTGCTMLLRSDVAKLALPFEKKYYVHDHWLALFASSVGRIAYHSNPLILYRIHDNNQIGNAKLKGISTREDYIRIRMQKEKETYNLLLSSQRFTNSKNEMIDSKLSWVIDREDFINKPSPKTFFKILLAIPKDPQLVLFEMFIALVPRTISTQILRKLRR